MSLVPVRTKGQINLEDGVDKDEWNRVKADRNADAKKEIKFMLADGTTVTRTFKEMEAIFKKNPNALVSLKADANGPGDGIKARGATIFSEIEGLKQKLREAELAKDKAQIEKLNNLISQKATQAQFMSTKGVSFTEAQMKAMQASLNTMGADNGSGQSNMQLRSTTTPGGSSSPGGTSAGAATGGAGGMKAQGVGGGQGAGSTSSNWRAQGVGGSGSGFDSNAYMQSMVVTENIMASWDEINKNSNRGKQLMMLFFYYAKMAESGDLGAMYQFMKFITYVVSKDKSKQQIEMGKKLIALQDLSRQWTNKLMETSSNANDPNASMELSKTMTLVKSETDAIATSQKLITQMMEEFAQVNELLMNVTKKCLDTNGMIQRALNK